MTRNIHIFSLDPESIFPGLLATQSTVLRTVPETAPPVQNDDELVGEGPNFARFLYYGDVAWASWNFKSPETRLFVRQFVDVIINRKNIKICDISLLWGESTGHIKTSVAKQSFGFDTRKTNVVNHIHHCNKCIVHIHKSILFWRVPRTSNQRRAIHIEYEHFGPGQCFIHVCICI